MRLDLTSDQLDTLMEALSLAEDELHDRLMQASTHCQECFNVSMPHVFCDHHRESMDELKRFRALAQEVYEVQPFESVASDAASIERSETSKSDAQEGGQ